MFNEMDTMPPSDPMSPGMPGMEGEQPLMTCPQCGFQGTAEEMSGMDANADPSAMAAPAQPAPEGEEADELGDSLTARNEMRPGIRRSRDPRDIAAKLREYGA